MKSRGREKLAESLKVYLQFFRCFFNNGRDLGVFKGRGVWYNKTLNKSGKQGDDGMQEPYLLELCNLFRRVSSEFYLRYVNLALKPGEVHAIVGKNASGKSTLFSVIIGNLPAEGGQVKIGGVPAVIKNPLDAGKQGIVLVGQNMQLFGNLMVYENVYFGQELLLNEKLKIMDNKRMIKNVEETFQKMNVSIHPKAVFGHLSAGEQQLVGIARAILSNAKVILLDEPSTHLSGEEKQRLYEAMKTLKAQGTSFLIISHDLDEVMAVADVVSVMEQGELLETSPIGAFDKNSLIEAVYGIKISSLYQKEEIPLGEELLRLTQVSSHAFEKVSFSMKKGELISVVGGSKSGKLDVARVIAGVCPGSGEILLEKETLPFGSPIESMRRGVVLASDETDREILKTSEEMVGQGATGTGMQKKMLSIKLAVSDLGKQFSSWTGLKEKEERMTGGNRQRERMEQALHKPGKVYLLCEPGAGIDVPTRARLYFEMQKLLKNGGGVILFTSDLEEALGLSDRIIALRRGRVVFDKPAKELTKEEISRQIEE